MLKPTFLLAPRLIVSLVPALLALTLGCTDSTGPLGVRYRLRNVNGDRVPSIVASDTALQTFSYVDSAIIDLRDEASPRFFLGTHAVRYLPGGDSLLGFYEFGLDVRVTQIPGAVVLEYRAKWDFVPGYFRFSGCGYRAAHPPRTHHSG